MVTAAANNRLKSQHSQDVEQAVSPNRIRYCEVPIRIKSSRAQYRPVRHGRCEIICRQSAYVPPPLPVLFVAIITMLLPSKVIPLNVGVAGTTVATVTEPIRCQVVRECATGRINRHTRRPRSPVY